MRGRGRGRRRPWFVGAALMATAGGVVAACGGDGTSTSREPVEVELVAGNAVLPPTDDPLIQGATIEQLSAPGDIPPDIVLQWAEHTPGRVVLYGDPTLEDPFEGPWVLALLLQGSESSGLGGRFDPRGTDTGWIDIPVEQLSQEGRDAGLLFGGLDPERARRLADGVEVRTEDGSPGAIEISAEALDAASGRMEALYAADVDAGFLGASHGQVGPVPGATWTRARTTDWARVAVSSWKDTPGLQLLLRSLTGGVEAGPNLMPVGGEGAIDQIITTRVVDDTLAQVQAQHVDLEDLTSFAGRLMPAGPQRWVELRDAAFLQPVTGNAVPNAQVVLDEVFGDVRVRNELSAGEVVGPFGPFESCTTSLSMSMRSGLGVPGASGSGGGPCPALGSVHLYPIDGRTIVRGILPPAATRMVVRTSAGQEIDVTPVGDHWKLYAVEVPGVGTVVEVQARAADGAVVARMGLERTPLGGTLAEAGGDLVAPG